MNLSLLVHTFEGYHHLWRGCSDSLVKHWDYYAHEAPIYWGTDVDPDRSLLDWEGYLILSGPGEWSDRLRKLLKQIPTDYVLYMQEDMWLTAPPPDLGILMHDLRKKGLLRLQISPITHLYTLFSEENTIYFDVKSKYLVSHQPSIWKKSFLLDCLKPGETPWINEYKGTLRLQQNSQIRQFIHKKIAIYPYEWYKHMCIKGKVVENG